MFIEVHFLPFEHKLIDMTLYQIDNFMRQIDTLTDIFSSQKRVISNSRVWLQYKWRTEITL